MFEGKYKIAFVNNEPWQHESVCSDLKFGKFGKALVGRESM